MSSVQRLLIGVCVLTLPIALAACVNWAQSTREANMATNRTIRLITTTGSVLECNSSTRRLSELVCKVVEDK